MNKNFKKAVATILEAINTVRWELDAVKRALRQNNQQYETVTCCRIMGPIIDEWVPLEKQLKRRKEVATEQLVEDLAQHLLQCGAIEITEKPTDMAAVYGLGHAQCTEYRATIRVAVPRKEEAQHGD